MILAVRDGIRVFLDHYFDNVFAVFRNWSLLKTDYLLRYKNNITLCGSSPTQFSCIVGVLYININFIRQHSEAILKRQLFKIRTYFTTNHPNQLAIHITNVLKIQNNQKWKPTSFLAHSLSVAIKKNKYAPVLSLRTFEFVIQK